MFALGMLLGGGVVAAGWWFAIVVCTFHAHEWGRWQRWGITYQMRECVTCGKRKVK